MMKRFFIFFVFSLFTFLFISSADAIVGDGSVKDYTQIGTGLNGFTLDTIGHEFGDSLAVIGDLDLNGVEDYVVGIPERVPPVVAEKTGSVMVLLMNSNQTVKSTVEITEDTGGFKENLSRTDRFGVSVAGVGDMNGDSIPDIAVGALYDDDGGNDHGALYILFLNRDGSVLDTKKEGIDRDYVKLTTGIDNFPIPLSNGSRFGASVAFLGDVDKDGNGDLAVGATYGGDSSKTGAVYILFMNGDAGIKSYQEISEDDGDFDFHISNGDLFAGSLGAAGDINDDNIPDLLIGAAGDDDEATNGGAAYLVFLSEKGKVKDNSQFKITGENFDEDFGQDNNFGASLVGIGDLNGDGTNDISVGKPGDHNGGEGDVGAVYVLFMNKNGSIKSHKKITQGESGFEKDLMHLDGFGSALAVSNIDKDELLDLVVGASYTDLDDNGSFLDDHGSIYLLEMAGLGVSINETGDKTSVKEAGETQDSFGVKLDSAPTATVNINIGGTSDVKLSTSKLTFDASNWNIEQVVTVTAIDDDLVEDSTHTEKISFSMSSSDSQYDGFEIPDLVVFISDNDSASYTISKGSLSLNEGGSQEVSIVLGSAPEELVEFSIESEDAGAVSVSTGLITFNSRNWSTAQTFIVTAKEDADENDEDVDINIRITGDDAFDALADFALSVSVSDDEAEGGIEVVEGDIDIVEGDVDLDEGGIEVVEGDIDIVDGENNDEGGIEVVEGDVDIVDGDVDLDEGGIEVVEGDIDIVDGENDDEGGVEVVEGDVDIVDGDADSNGGSSNGGTSSADDEDQDEEESEEDDEEIVDCSLEIGHAYKSREASAVYYITDDCTKKAFSKPNKFFSYFESWDDVEVVAAWKIAEVPFDQHKFMGWGPRWETQYGAFVKTLDDPKVYILLGGERKWITNPEVFETLYGKAAWGMIEDVDRRLLEKYDLGGVIDYTDHHPNMTIIKYANDPKVYILKADSEDPNKQKKHHITSPEVFNKLNYRWDRIVTIIDEEVYETGNPLY